MSNINIRGLKQYNAQAAALTTQQFNWNNIASIPAINLNDILTSYPYNTDYVKKYEIIETTEDALAVSVAHKRLTSTKNYHGGIPLRTILDSQIFDKITDDDRETANKIRTYYAHQFVMWTLKDIKLTKFRDSLSSYINGDSKRFKEEYIPIIAKLPYFYEYDIQLDEIKRPINGDIDIDKSLQITSHRMTPVKSLVRKNKRIKCIEYWLSDRNNHAYNIQIEINNPLQHLWDNIFSKEELIINGFGAPKRRDDFKYYQLLKWSMA
jgi:hypothetical protein